MPRFSRRGVRSISSNLVTTGEVIRVRDADIVEVCIAIVGAVVPHLEIGTQETSIT
jgi:hypothetical protein